ncbi:MAG: hypothetical protein WKG07_35815 [Hymenobacter sp.]
MTEETAWEYGAELPEVEVTPEQLDSAEALVHAGHPPVQPTHR